MLGGLDSSRPSSVVRKSCRTFGHKRRCFKSDNHIPANHWRGDCPGGAKVAQIAVGEVRIDAAFITALDQRAGEVCA
jgi:hypothetical protein